MWRICMLLISVYLSTLPSVALAASKTRNEWQPLLEAQLRKLNTLARCDAAKHDTEQFSSYTHIGELLFAAAIHYHSQEASQARDETVGLAVNQAFDAYRRAFECVPIYEYRYPITRALLLVKWRINNLKDNPAAAAKMKAMRQKLLAQLPAPPPPRTVAIPCPVCKKPQPAPRPKPKDPLRQFSLRPEFGLVTPIPIYGIIGLYTGIRRELKNVHLLEFGSRYSLKFHRFTVHSISVVARYGAQLLNNKLSLHAELSAGMSLFRDHFSYSSGHVALGPSICTYKELLCLNYRHFFAPGRGVILLYAPVFTLSVDLLRLAQQTSARKMRFAKVSQ